MAWIASFRSAWEALSGHRSANLAAIERMACMACTESPRVEAQDPARNQWWAHPSNPIVKAGDLRERGFWGDPCVLRLDEGTYVMYMSSSSVEEPFKAPILPFRAVSKDYISWRLDSATSVLHPAGTPYIVSGF